MKKLKCLFGFHNIYEAMGSNNNWCLNCGKYMDNEHRSGAIPVKDEQGLESFLIPIATRDFKSEDKQILNKK